MVLRYAGLFAGVAQYLKNLFILSFADGRRINMKGIVTAIITSDYYQLLLATIIAGGYYQPVPQVIQNARIVYLKVSAFRSQPKGVVPLF